ncbi:MAG TPA: SDR family oxidoreductase [Lentisphaeria bacterium]|nr:SDR family oxidoreductase [Lentisphaerota bacterium]OQC12001.1 MAG: putative oxidoreductase [Lentisphaerae bacterium ADurb.Bin082]HQC52841.1 SDR family oxidoreductase [Lentisphaeria bacterium]HQL09135.1 SDR family oxidoreductase [Lentisphaeria bacterium]
MNCTGKTIIITGGSSGYGYGMAKKLRARGARVLITGRNEQKLRQAAAEIGVEAVHADVTSSADWDRVFVAAGNRVDVLINNAGGGLKVAPLTDYSDEEIIQSIAINLTGALLGCRRAAAVMIPQKSGLIINISSVCAHYGWPGFAVYTAAKAGLDKMSRALYTELRPHNVRVTVVTPSWGDTNFNVAAGLPPPTADLAAQMMSSDQMGDLIVQLCEFHDHLVFPEIMVQPVVQEINPF